jgi:integrase
MATIIRRTLKDGTTRYDAQIRRQGVVRKRSHRTRAAAEHWARKVEAEIDDGRDTPTAAAERRTVAEVLDAYTGEALEALRTADQRRRQLAWWSKRIGSIPIRQLDRETVRAGLAALERGDTPSGNPSSAANRRRFVAALSAALSWAEDRGLVDRNVAKGAARRGRDVEPPGRVRYLTDEEREALLEACAEEREPRLVPMLKLALLTGMRRGELLGLRWADVDLDRGLASLPRTKSGHPRSVALSTPAVELLRDLYRDRVLGWPHVFANRKSWGKPTFPRAAFDRAVARARLEDFRWHDLRHTFASYLLSAGATLPELAAALGHRSLAMVQRYAHLERPHAARLAEQVADRISPT